MECIVLYRLLSENCETFRPAISDLKSCLAAHLMKRLFALQKAGKNRNAGARFAGW